MRAFSAWRVLRRSSNISIGHSTASLRRFANSSVASVWGVYSPFMFRGRPIMIFSIFSSSQIFLISLKRVSSLRKESVFLGKANFWAGSLIATPVLRLP